MDWVAESTSKSVHHSKRYCQLRSKNQANLPSPNGKWDPCLHLPSLIMERVYLSTDGRVKTDLTSFEQNYP